VALLNEGSIITSVVGDKPANSTPVLILAGGSLPSFTNSGAVSGLANSSDLAIASLNAYGVRDSSGTLTTVVNSGRLTAQATALTNNAQQTIAADLSHGSANRALPIPEPFIGDIIFGSAGMSGGVAGNQLIIHGANATVQGAVRAVGAGTIDVHLGDDDHRRGLAYAKRADHHAHAGFGRDGGMALDQASGNCADHFGDRPGGLPHRLQGHAGALDLPAGQRHLHADSQRRPEFRRLRGGHLGSADSFHLQWRHHPQRQRLLLTLQRKTAAQLGLTGNVATIYEPLAKAALADNEFGAALLTLGTAAEVQAVVKRIGA